MEIKYKIKEVADDFAMPAKDVIEAVGKFFPKPKSSSQNLSEEQLNVVFDYITQNHQISSLEEVFAAAKPKEAPAESAPAPQPQSAQPSPAAQQKPQSASVQKPAAPAQRPAQNAPAAQQKPQMQPRPQPSAQPSAKPQSQPQPERKRERRVIDTSAVTVNADRYDDRVDSLVSERVQNYQSGKQKIGNKNKKQQQAKKFGRMLSELDSISKPLFVALGEMDGDDSRWNDPALSHWRFNVMEKKHSWKNGLSSQDNTTITAFAATNFFPVDAMFKRLNKTLNVSAQKSNGEQVQLSHAQCMGVLKGADDARLRQTAQKAVNAWYKEHAGFYVDLLNLLHGFRKTQFQLAGLNDWMRPSLEQNRISGQALEAAMSAIRARADEIREAITARAPFFGKEKMSACHFFVPLPQKKASDAYIPYPQAIETLKAALKDVNPQIPEFVDMMLDKHWLEARVDAKKAGGAFYSRFNRLKQPRVFTTYLGSFGSVLQQAHELGHAFHYWVMRDMPTNQTEFPMTLTEVASTFNEAAVRRYCAGMAAGSKEHWCNTSLS